MLKENDVPCPVNVADLATNLTCCTPRPLNSEWINTKRNRSKLADNECADTDSRPDVEDLGSLDWDTTITQCVQHVDHTNQPSIWQSTQDAPTAIYLPQTNGTPQRSDCSSARQATKIVER